MFMMKISGKMNSHSASLCPGTCRYEAGVLRLHYNIQSAEFLNEDEGGNVRFIIKEADISITILIYGMY
jgi:hypothetical protein